MKKSKPNPKANKSILWFAYGVVALFLLMGAYMGYFIQAESEEVINNPYNSRLDSLSDRIIRGKILSSDGTVLAETSVAEDGSETRIYPYGELFAHVVGYSTAGKTGIESLANFYLLSSHVNLIEKTVNELADQKNIGDNVVTTLDLALQKTASDALGDNRGAVLAIEPSTGKILAMVSKPAFDPNTVAAEWDSLVNGDSSEARLLNRATQGLYPPGSTFKLLTALEYMREHPGDYNDYTFSCDGIFEYEEFKIQCASQTAHGNVDFGLAFADSCNGAFANLGLSLDLNRLYSLSEELLYNKELPLSLPYNKSSFTMTDGASDWEILQTSIGQGSTLMTPIHNAMLAAAIANGGVLMKPYVLDHVENAGGQVVKRFSPSEYGSLITEAEAGALKDLMVRVVNEGTGSRVKSDAYQAAGKTGSAQFEAGKEAHAWFIGFAPADDPKIAVCVIVEQGSSGGRVAAPIARQLFDCYLGQ